MIGWIFDLVCFFNPRWWLRYVVVLGLPNAGKTTLLRRLSSHVRSDVSLYESCQHPDLVVFVVDALDRDSFAKAKCAIDVVRALEIPFVVVGNKVDVPIAASAAELSAVLEVPEVIMCSAVCDVGCEDLARRLLQ